MIPVHKVWALCQAPSTPCCTRSVYSRPWGSP